MENEDKWYWDLDFLFLVFIAVCVFVVFIFYPIDQKNKTHLQDRKDSLKVVIAQYEDSLKATQQQLNTTTAQLVKQDSFIKLLTQNRQKEILKIDTLTVGELYNYFKEY